MENLSIARDDARARHMLALYNDLAAAAPDLAYKAGAARIDPAVEDAVIAAGEDGHLIAVEGYDVGAGARLEPIGGDAKGPGPALMGCGKEGTPAGGTRAKGLRRCRTRRWA